MRGTTSPAKHQPIFFPIGRASKIKGQSHQWLDQSDQWARNRNFQRVRPAIVQPVGLKRQIMARRVFGCGCSRNWPPDPQILCNSSALQSSEPTSTRPLLRGGGSRHRPFSWRPDHQNQCHGRREWTACPNHFGIRSGLRQCGRSRSSGNTRGGRRRGRGSRPSKRAIIHLLARARPNASIHVRPKGFSARKPGPPAMAQRLIQTREWSPRMTALLYQYAVSRSPRAAGIGGRRPR